MNECGNILLTTFLISFRITKTPHFQGKYGIKIAEKELEAVNLA
jgi:hypothetical protein